MSRAASAERYHRVQMWIGLGRLAVGLTVLAAAVLSGYARPVSEAVARLGGGPAMQVALLALTLGLVHGAATLPLAWLGGFVLPRRFGLLHQPPRGWVADRAKAAALSGTVALLGLEVVYLLLQVAPARWWLLASALALAFGMAVTAVVPVGILPLFYRLAPLADDGLRHRLLALAERAGVPALGVWVADQSRKSRTANAAVVGLGRTRRIVVHDTLTTGFRPEEVEAVLAHELGHHVHGDIRRGLVVQGLLALVTFWVADRLLHAGVALWGLRDVADPAGVPWLTLVLVALGLAAAPLGNAFSRHIERQADDFALALTGDPDAFIGAMERLAALNLTERRPHRLKEMILYSHPALDRRIARARAA